MSFLVLLLCGVIGGVLGGMGMGGGTALIPLLTLGLKVEQSIAQGVNLLSFLPMSAVALSLHAKAGLLQKRGLPSLWIPALLASVLFSLAAARLPSAALRLCFGLFLTGSGLFRLHSARNFGAKMNKSDKSNKF